MFTSVALVATALIASASAVEAATCYRLPFSNPNLADGFGSKKNRTNPHRGVDFPQPAGKAIPAVATGRVSVVTRTSCLGNVIVLKHADGKYSGYSHLQVKSPHAVGKAITRGQTIGKVGSTGSCSTGPHLHLTMSPSRTGYAYGTVIDPYKWIRNHLCSNARILETDDGAFEVDDAIDLEEAEMAAIIAAAESETILDDTLEGVDDEDARVDGDDEAPVVDEVIDENEDEPTDEELAQGCAAGGGDALGAVGLGALAVVLRRRRKR